MAVLLRINDVYKINRTKPSHSRSRRKYHAVSQWANMQRRAWSDGRMLPGRPASAN